MLSSSRLVVRLTLRAQSKALRHPQVTTRIVATHLSPVPQCHAFSSWLENSIGNSNERAATSTSASQAADAPTDSATVKVEQVKLEACGDLDDDDDEMEQEEMFVEAYDSPSFSHGIQEWGGPRRGGRLPEPTRFGDWERKGRCSDF